MAKQKTTVQLQGKTHVLGVNERVPDETVVNQEATQRTKGTGDVLNNRFELRDRVGSGGMSTVYKAVDRRKVEANDREPYVAVKVLNVEFRTHPAALMALQREAKKCQGLAHPNIVRVYDFDRDGSTVYMTMEFLSGMSLERKIGRPGFTGMVQGEALKIINAVGEALRFAHQARIVHADFKPANVFIPDDGKIKVIDFGIARAFASDDAVDLEATRFDPASLGALTPSYASPEMLEHEEPDPRDDIYALACTAYLILTGRHPFGRMPATVARETALPVKRHEALTRSQFKALRHALEFDRNNRTPTVEQFLKEINRPAVTIVQYASYLGLSAILTVLAAAAGYYLLKGSGDDSAADDLAVVEQPVPKKPITTDEITPLLDRLSCAALKASVSDGNLSVRGFARQQETESLARSLSGLAGAGQADLSDIKTVGQHQCVIIERLSSFWRRNQDLKNRTAITSNNPDNLYLEGDNLILNIATPHYDAFLYVDYYTLDGGVLHLVPSAMIKENQAPAHYSATIGDLGEWAIAEPFGQELIVVMATTEPLFDSLRKEYEPQTDYLSDLEKRLAQLQARGEAEQLTADFYLITTKAR